MNEIVAGSIWNFMGTKTNDIPNCIAIPTNGTVRRDGACVMGRGLAKDAVIRFPNLPFELGSKLRKEYNQSFYWPNYALVTIPVKHNWYEKATLVLIECSLIQVKHLWKDHTEILYLPKLGCGNGKLDWVDVKPIMESIIDDDPRFVVVSQT